MERKYFKALNFDLDTHQLKEHYPGANYRQAYDDLRRFFKRHRFSHRQGSGYISDDKLATADIYDLMDELSRQFPWIGICVNKIDVTNVGRQHDLTELLKPAEDIVIDTSLLTVPDCPQQSVRQRLQHNQKQDTARKQADIFFILMCGQKPGQNGQKH